jgi:hypothetical protein
MYDSGMSRRVSLLPILRRRFTALVTLFVFVVGNIGWPQSAEKPGERGCCGRLVKLSSGGGCCCGKDKRKASCGCRKALVDTKTAICCQKKKPSGEKPVVAASACNCGDAPFPGFIVSSQPKLAAAVVTIPRLVETFAVSLTSSLRAPEGNFCPDTPPPRPSLC